MCTDAYIPSLHTGALPHPPTLHTTLLQASFDLPRPTTPTSNYIYYKFPDMAVLTCKTYCILRKFFACDECKHRKVCSSRGICANCIRDAKRCRYSSPHRKTCKSSTLHLIYTGIGLNINLRMSWVVTQVVKLKDWRACRGIRLLRGCPIN